MGIPRKHLAQGEQVVLHLRTHIKALFLPTLALVVVLGLAATAAWAVPEGEAQQPVGIAVAVVALGLIGWLFALPVLRWATTTYTVTNRRLITRSGILTRTGHDIPLYRINDVQIEKHLIDRLFGCGTLLIANASEHGGVRLNDVPQVEQVQVQINDLLHMADDGSDDGNFVPAEPGRR